MPLNNPRSFREEALFQAVCALCGKRGDFHAHHVVDKQTLRGAGLPDDALYDTRNALRLCPRKCHFQFEARMVEIPLNHLLDQNIEYAVEVLGRGKAYNYLRRQYSGSDPRVEAILGGGDGAGTRPVQG